MEGTKALEPSADTNIVQSDSNDEGEVGTEKVTKKPMSSKRKVALAFLIVILLVVGTLAAFRRPLLAKYNASSVSLKVREGDKFALAGALVTMNGTSYTTDENGKISLQAIPAGTYDYVVHKDGYTDLPGTLQLHRGDNDLQFLSLVKLPDKVYAVKGFVKDSVSGQTLANVQVTLGSKTVITDPSGSYVFSNVAPSDSMTLFLSIAGYIDRQLVLKVVNADVLTAAVPLVPKGQLVFASNRDGQRHLYTSAYDGSGQKVFASGTGEDFSPVVAPDNTHVAFNSTRDHVKDGYGNDAAKLYIASLDGKTVTKVADDVAASIKPIWSPNGQSIYFSAYTSAKYDQSSYKVYDVVHSKLLDIGEQVGEAVFSSDGSVVAYYAFATETAPQASSTPSPLPSSTLSASPTASPVPVPSQVNINVVKTLNILTGERKTLVKKEQYLSDLRFAADNSTVSYEAIIEGIRRRFQYKLSSGVELEIPVLAVAKRKTVPSPDLTKLAFIEARDGKTDLYIVNADGSNEKRLTTLGVLNDQTLPHWDATGRYITFAVHREAENGIYIAAVAGGDPQKVTDYFAESL